MHKFYTGSLLRTLTTGFLILFGALVLNAAGTSTVGAVASPNATFCQSLYTAVAAGYTPGEFPGLLRGTNLENLLEVLTIEKAQLPDFTASAALAPAPAISAALTTFVKDANKSLTYLKKGVAELTLIKDKKIAKTPAHTALAVRDVALANKWAKLGVTALTVVNTQVNGDCAVYVNAQQANSDVLSVATDAVAIASGNETPVTSAALKSAVNNSGVTLVSSTVSGNYVTAAEFQTIVSGEVYTVCVGFGGVNASPNNTSVLTLTAKS